MRSCINNIPYPFNAWYSLKGHTHLNLPLGAAVLFKYVRPFVGQQTLKTYGMKQSDYVYQNVSYKNVNLDTWLEENPEDLALMI